MRISSVIAYPFDAAAIWHRCTSTSAFHTSWDLFASSLQPFFTQLYSFENLLLLQIGYIQQVQTRPNNNPQTPTVTPAVSFDGLCARFGLAYKFLTWIHRQAIQLLRNIPIHHLRKEAGLNRLQLGCRHLLPDQWQAALIASLAIQLLCPFHQIKLLRNYLFRRFKHAASAECRELKLMAIRRRIMRVERSLPCHLYSLSCITASLRSSEDRQLTCFTYL